MAVENMFAAFTQHDLHFRLNSRFIKFYETVLFMSRCSPGPKLTKQQQMCPAPSKTKEEVKWFSWLAGLYAGYSDLMTRMILFNFVNECRIMNDLIYKCRVFRSPCQLTVNGVMCVSLDLILSCVEKVWL